MRTATSMVLDMLTESNPELFRRQQQPLAEAPGAAITTSAAAAGGSRPCWPSSPLGEAFALLAESRPEFRRLGVLHSAIGPRASRPRASAASAAATAEHRSQPASSRRGVPPPRSPLLPLPLRRQQQQACPPAEPPPHAAAPPLDGTMFSLAGKVVIVTGASSGMGESMAAAFLAHGCKTVYVGRRESMLAEVAALNSPNALAVLADMAKPEAATIIRDETLAKWGRIDCLINNAGSTDVATGEPRQLLRLTGCPPLDCSFPFTLAVTMTNGMSLAPVQARVGSRKPIRTLRGCSNTHWPST